MKSRIPKLKSTLLLTTALVFLVVGTAVAATITIDGDPTDWPGHPSCTIGNSGCALEQTDADESSSTTLPAGNDIREVWVTNDPSNVFFRVDTEANTVYSNGEFVRICLDIPNQGPGQSNIGGCSGFDTDRLVLIQNRGSGVQGFLYDCNSVDCNNLFASTTGNGTASTSSGVTEVEVALSDLGLGGADDGDMISTILYFDNNANPPDDNVPNSGSFGWQIGTNSPTMITLDDVTAESDAGILFTSTFVLVGLVGLGGIGFALTHRRRQK